LIQGNSYIVANVKRWNNEAFKRRLSELPGTWSFISAREELTVEFLESLSPRYIFFPHWSWIVPNEILSRWECVCFHMADVPYGRGGSPLQNLIARKHTETKLTALRMTNDLDAGPVYKKVPLSLDGSAQEIFERMAPEIVGLAREIAMEEPDPVEQTGEVTLFKRRTPEQCVVPLSAGLEDVYDHIRMLDAETYPKAFVEIGNLRFEFTNAELSNESEIIAKVKIEQVLRESK